MEIVRSIWREEIQTWNLGFGYHSLHDFVTSSCLPGRHGYLVWRVFVSVYLSLWCILTATLNSDWYNRPENKIKYFIYFSDWTFILMTLAAHMQLFIMVRHLSSIQYRPTVTDDFPNDLPVDVKLTWLLYTVSADGALIVSAFYWLFLYQGLRPSLVTVHLHIFNSIYVITDLILSSIPIRLIHVIYSIIYGLTYIIFVLIYKIIGGTGAKDESFIYWILNWDYPMRALFFSLLGILCSVPAHFVIFLIFRIRKKLTDKKTDDTEPLLE